MSRRLSAEPKRKEMIMKNILGALALMGFGIIASGSAQASPAASLAGIGEQAPAVEQVHYYGKRFYGRHYWGGYKPYYYGYKHYGYGYKHYGYGYSWKRHCYHHPYHWKCKHYGYDY